MRLAAVLAFILFALPAFAHHYTLGDLNIGHVWSPATTPKATLGAVYMPIENTGKEDDTLQSAETPAAEKVEFHQTKIENGVAKMRKVDEVKLPARKKTEFKTGGLHIMLVGLKQQLKNGGRATLTLHFAKAGTIEVEIHVQKGVMHEHDHEGMTGTDHEHHH